MTELLRFAGSLFLFQSENYDCFFKTCNPQYATGKTLAVNLKGLYPLKGCKMIHGRKKTAYLLHSCN